MDFQSINLTSTLVFHLIAATVFCDVLKKCSILYKVLKRKKRNCIVPGVYGAVYNRQRYLKGSRTWKT